MAESTKKQGSPTGTSTRNTAAAAADDYSKYEVNSPTEVLAILKGMIEQGSLITFYFNQGYDFLLTSLLRVSADGKSMIFDYGSNMEMNRKALQAKKINCVSSKDKVRIQFNLSGLETVRHEKRDAFLADVPPFLVRLQRREFFRMTTPMTNPARANIPLPQEDGSLKMLQAVVSDIGGGGVGLNVPQGETGLTRDAEFSGVAIKLPDIGTATVEMRVRNIHDVTSPNGKIHQHAVCQFVNISRPMRDLVQRYITKIQRERLVR